MPDQNPTGAPQMVKRERLVPGVHVRELEDGAQSRVIEGYAIRFNEQSDALYSYDDEELREVIAPEAVTDELLAASDIKLTMFHNREILLARSNKGSGSLTYTRDEHGVKFSAEMPNTADGDKALEAVRRGDIAGCSFMFSTYYRDPQHVSIERHVEGERALIVATVRSIKAIQDFTLAIDPAYPTTSVNMRELIGREEPAPPATEETSTNAEETIENIETNNNQNSNNMPPETNNPREQRSSLTTLVREGLRTHRRFELSISRREGEPAGADTGASSAVINTNAVTPSGLVPITVKEILEDIDKGIIYDKIGIPLTHNNTGEFLWPSYSAGEAKIVGEGVAVAPSEIKFDKLTATPERFAIRFDLTYESVMQSNGVVEDIVRKALALAMQRAINRLILSTTKVEGSARLQGPFVGLTPVSLPKNVTFKSVNKLKGKLLSTDIDLNNPLFVMHPATACDLESTPKDVGSGIMLIENGRLCGYPVYTSKYVPENNIGLGDFNYQAAGFFGEMRLIVDPYTNAESNMVRFILNVDFATKTLRPEAFVLGQIATA